MVWTSIKVLSAVYCLILAGTIFALSKFNFSREEYYIPDTPDPKILGPPSNIGVGKFKPESTF